MKNYKQWILTEENLTNAKISSNVLHALNEQFDTESMNARIYFHMASYAQDEGFNGISKWFVIQAKEEQGHADMVREHIFSRRSHLEVGSLPKPNIKINSILEAFEKGLQQEEKNTECFKKIYKIASIENDQITCQFAKNFLKEQAEEENLFQTIIDKIKHAGENPPGLYLIDKELGIRI